MRRVESLPEVQLGWNILIGSLLVVVNDRLPAFGDGQIKKPQSMLDVMACWVLKVTKVLSELSLQGEHFVFIIFTTHSLGEKRRC
jgi:hypothetical protein